MHCGWRLRHLSGTRHPHGIGFVAKRPPAAGPRVGRSELRAGPLAHAPFRRKTAPRRARSRRLAERMTSRAGSRPTGADRRPGKAGPLAIARPLSDAPHGAPPSRSASVESPAPTTLPAAPQTRCERPCLCNHRDRGLPGARPRKAGTPSDARKLRHGGSSLSMTLGQPSAILPCLHPSVDLGTINITISIKITGSTI